MGRTFRMMTIAAASGAAVFLTAGSAAAHVSANPGEAPAGGHTKQSFRVGHGCAGSPTTKLSIQIPAGVTSVHPEVVPGWTIDVTEGPFDEPVTVNGETVTEGVTEVSWTGGPLPDGHLTEFGIGMRMPDREGETLYFPAVQTCEEGEIGWITIPVEGEAEPAEPAPGVTLTAASGGHGSMASDGDTEEPATGSESESEEPASAEQAGATEDDDEGADGMAVAGLIAGIAGVVLGGSALGVAMRRKNASS